MKITAAELKKSLKVFGPIRTESYQIGEHGVSAQDPDAWVIADSPLSGLEGCFSVNGKKLGQVVNRMSGEIEITKEDRKLTLRSAKAKVDLEVQNIKPLKIPAVPEKLQVLGAEAFKKALTVAVGSASPNKSAAFGGVVQIQTLPMGIEETTPQGYRIVGTDGNVLTVAVVNNKTEVEFKVLLNLAAAAVVQIMDGETVSFGETNTNLWFKAGVVTLFASKPTQIYPDFEKVISVQPKLRFQFNSEEWLSALRTVEPLMDDSVDNGAFTVQMADGVVQLGSIGGAATDEATYEQIQPDPIFEDAVKVSGLRLHAKYVSQFLSRVSGEAVLNLTEKDKPVKFESGNVMTLMMPQMTKKETK